MVSYEVYKILHLIGIFVLFTSLGGLALYTINGGTKSENKWRKVASISHGVSLVLILVGGFGLLARLGVPHANWPFWVYAKFGIWLLFGGAIALVSRKDTLAKVAWFLLPILGGLSAFFAVYKPTL